MHDLAESIPRLRPIAVDDASHHVDDALDHIDNATDHHRDAADDALDERQHRLNGRQQCRADKADDRRNDGGHQRRESLNHRHQSLNHAGNRLHHRRNQRLKALNHRRDGSHHVSDETADLRDDRHERLNHSRDGRDHRRDNRLDSLDGRSYRLNDGGHHGQNALNGRHQSTHKRGDYRRQQRDYLADEIGDYRHDSCRQLTQSRHERLNRRLKHLECLLQADENVLQHRAEFAAQLRARGDKAGQRANHQRDRTTKTTQDAAELRQQSANHRHATQSAQSAAKTSRAKQTSHGCDRAGQSRQLAREAAEIDFADLVSDSAEHFFKRRADLLGQCGHLVEKRGDERFDGLHHLDDRAADTTESRDQIIADRSLQSSDFMLQDGHLALRRVRQGLVDAAEIRFQDLRGHGCLFGRATLLKDLLLRVRHGHAIFAQRGSRACHDLAKQIRYLHAILRRRVITFVVGDHVRQSGRQRLDLIGRQRESAELCLSGLQGATGYDAGLAKRLVQSEQ